MRIVTPDEKNGIYLGRQGENLATQVQFDVNVAGWVETYGVGTWQLLNRRPSDPAGYPVEISVEDNIIKWDLTATDLKYAGCGTCELVYYVDEVIAKSIIYGTQILPAIDGTGEIPEPWESWIDEVEQARDDAQAAAEAAEGSASSAEGFAQDASASAAEASDSAYAAGQSADAAEDSADAAKDEADRAAELADQIEHSIDDIEALIPTQASPENQLADKNFVNSSISTNTANYISNNGQPFTSVAQLEAYSGTVTNNDYAFVTGTDEAGNTYYDRYKAQVSGGVVTWAKEYRLNNSSFTAAQWAAIESGITATLVASYSAHLADTNNPHAVTKDQVGLGNVDNTPDAQKPVSQAQAAALALKADKVVDAVAGDFAALDENGNLADSGISPSDLELVKEVSNDPASSSFDIAIRDGQPAPVLGAVLKGKTVAINQLVNNGDFSSTTGWTLLNATLTAEANVGTMTATAANGQIVKRVTAIAGHTYAVFATIKATTATTLIRLNPSSMDSWFIISAATTVWQTLAGIRTASSSGNKDIAIIDARTSGWDAIQIKNVMWIDLTLCGFAAEETVNVATLKAAWLKKYGVPMPQYIPNNAGSILSNNATYQLTGRNLWDENWSVGLEDISITTGNVIPASSNYFRSVDYIRITGGQVYHDQHIGETRQYRLFFYDANKQFISYISHAANTQFTPPDNACYMMFRWSCSGAYVYKHNVCINESDPAFNGQYEAHVDGGSIQGDDLNGFDGTDVFDTQSLTEKRRKCGKVDLGSLTWVYQSDYAYFEASVNTGKFSDNILSPMYVYGGKNNTRSDMGSAPNMTMYSRNQGQTYLILFVKNTAYTSAATFKTAMSGQYLVFELATPTSETVTGASLETKEGYNLLRSVSGDLQSGEVSMTYVKSSYLAKLIAWIRSIL